jgi:hypothetical protein
LKSRILKIAVLAAVLFAWNKFSLAEEFKVSLDALFEECYKSQESAEEQVFVWWFPRQWWEVNLQQYPIATGDDLSKMLALLKPYNMMFAVRWSVVSPYGAVSYKSKEELKKMIRLRDRRGYIYSPLDDNQIDLEVRNLLATMTPMVAAKAITLGQNMYFFIFPGEDQDGQEIAEAKKPGRFSLKLGEKEFTWKLPLYALFPSQICPLCKRELRSDYKYCPYDGTRLTEEAH